MLFFADGDGIAAASYSGGRTLNDVSSPAPSSPPPLLLSPPFLCSPPLSSSPPSSPPPLPASSLPLLFSAYTLRSLSLPPSPSPLLPFPLLLPLPAH
eukprot:1018919-Rhodomonas_salina.2